MRLLPALGILGLGAVVLAASVDLAPDHSMTFGPGRADIGVVASAEPAPLQEAPQTARRSLPPAPAPGSGAQQRRPLPAPPARPTAFQVAPIAVFNEPWAMTFLPDGRLLVTLKGGTLRLFNPATLAVASVAGVPTVSYGGQGGLGDVVLHPRFAENSLVYLSYAEPGTSGLRGAVVARATLAFNSDGDAQLNGLQVIWRQLPKTSGSGHYGHRLAFAPDGHLFITSGDRQLLNPAQDMASGLGKIVRVRDDGSLPADNPFAGQGGVAAEIWTLGHRNPLGIAFDARGRLWSHEMGPAGGDEMNLIERGTNYGWPIVSDGNHYDGTPIPDHSTRPEFNAPKVSWRSTVAPSGMVIYRGTLFPAFRGNAFVGGLASQALIRVGLSGAYARELQRYPMGRRIREVEEGPDGALWVLEDGSNARLLKLTPAP